MTPRLLLIDDDPDEEQIFLHNLKLLGTGWDFHYCSDIQSALKKMSERIFDFIFIDMNMPGTNGIACVKIIRTNENFASVPLIMYSTGMSPADCERAVLSGAAICVPKSPSCRELLQCLKNLNSVFGER